MFPFSLNNTCEGGCYTISPPIASPPPPCPPIGLLPAPHRARVKEVFSAHHEQVGGASAILREQSRFHRTRTSRPMSEGASNVGRVPRCVVPYRWYNVHQKWGFFALRCNECAEHLFKHVRIPDWQCRSWSITPSIEKGIYDRPKVLVL